MPEPRSFNPLEGFARALTGFSAGLQGRPSPYQQQDLERERMQQQAGQFETTEKRLQEALQIQKDQFERQDALTRAQIFKFALESLPQGQALLADIPDEGKRQKAAEALARLTSQAFQFGTSKADPTMSDLATPEFLKDLYLGGPQSLTLVDDIEFTLPEQRQAVAPLVKAGKIKEARETLTAISHQQQDQILGGVYERIRGLPPVEGGYDPETAFRLANVSRIERRAIDLLPNRFDAGKLDMFYQQAGLIPPSRTARVAEKRALIAPTTEEAGAVQRAKEATSGGQAAIALQQAQTTAAQTPIVTPLQMGAGVAVTPKGAGAIPQMVLPPEPKPVPLSPKERELITEEATALQTHDALASLYQPTFVGPVRGRLGGVGETTGNITGPEAQFRAQAAAIKNAVIAKLAGANVPKNEERRMLSQIPNVDDPPVVFEAKLRQTRSNLLKLAQMRREVLSKTGADISRLPPLPTDPSDPLGIR